MNLHELLSHLVSIPSSYPGEEKIGSFVETILKEMDFKVNPQKVGDKRFNILSEKGKGPALLIFGHLDTVKEKEGWNTNPYVLTEKGDNLYGLGAWDMKSGLATILSAMKNFSPKKYKLKLAFVVDEEYMSLGMHSLIKSGWLKDVFGAIVPEPGFTYGIRGIAMGRIGRPLFRIVVKTKGGHVYFAKDRVNAIEEANKVLRVLKKIKPVFHRDLGASFLFPRAIRSEAQSMAIPDRVEIEVEGQTVPPQTTESVCKEIKNIITKEEERGKINAEVFVEQVVRPTPFCEPFVIDQKNPFVGTVSDIFEDTTKEKPVFYYRRSVGDENRVAHLGIPVLTIGPAGGNAHEANEWVSKKSISSLEKFLINLLACDFDFT